MTNSEENNTGAGAITSWVSPHICDVISNRTCLCVAELSILPTAQSMSVMDAIETAIQSCGLRVLTKSASRFEAERIEAPFLAGGRYEWRQLIVTLGISRGVTAWGGVERLLLLRFVSDALPPIPPAPFLGVIFRKAPIKSDSSSDITFATERSELRAKGVKQAIAESLEKLSLSTTICTGWGTLVGMNGQVAEGSESRMMALDLSFVEEVRRRALSVALQDTSAAWAPLEVLIKKLKTQCTALQNILEPVYYQAGLTMPPLPETSQKDSKSNTSVGDATENGWRHADGMVVLAADSRFRRDGAFVHVSVGVPMSECASGEEERRDIEFGAVVCTASWQLHTALKAEAEAKAEEMVVSRLKSAQENVKLLEDWRRICIDCVTLPSMKGQGGVWEGELQSTFGTAEERLLYSCQAALGRHPGRLYVTRSRLWFHSKVLFSERKFTLPLSTVISVKLAPSVLNLSCALVLGTVHKEEVVLVFPGEGVQELTFLCLLVETLVELVRETSIHLDKKVERIEKSTEIHADKNDGSTGGSIEKDILVDEGQETVPDINGEHANSDAEVAGL